MRPIVGDSRTLKENLYLNVYMSLIDRIGKGDNKGVEILKQLGHEVKNWPDIETPSSRTLADSLNDNEENK